MNVLSSIILLKPLIMQPCRLGSSFPDAQGYQHGNMVYCHCFHRVKKSSQTY